jgi:hypothetical protein
MQFIEKYLDKKKWGQPIYRVTLGDLIPDTQRESLKQFTFPDEFSGSIGFMDLINSRRRIFNYKKEIYQDVPALSVLYLGIEPAYQGRLEYLIRFRDKMYSLAKDWDVKAIIADKIKNHRFKRTIEREGFVSLHQNGSRYFAYKLVDTL